MLQAKGHLPFFDVAYQGFATGSLEEDAFAPRYFVERGLEFAVAQSYSKVGRGWGWGTRPVRRPAAGAWRRCRPGPGNARQPCSLGLGPNRHGAHTLYPPESSPHPTSPRPTLQNLGLYAERVGAMSFVLSEAGAAQRVLSQMKRIARAIYSNPPVHGARIVAEVVGSEEMFGEWKGEMEMMAGRIKVGVLGRAGPGQAGRLGQNEGCGACGNNKRWYRLTLLQ